MKVGRFRLLGKKPLRAILETLLSIASLSQLDTGFVSGTKSRLDPGRNNPGSATILTKGSGFLVLWCKILKNSTKFAMLLRSTEMLQRK
jgi:hypothetical protein